MFPVLLLQALTQYFSPSHGCHLAWPPQQSFLNKLCKQVALIYMLLECFFDSFRNTHFLRRPGPPCPPG